MDEYSVEEPEQVNVISISKGQKDETVDFKGILEKSNGFPKGSIVVEKSIDKVQYTFGGKIVFTEYLKKRVMPKDIDD